MSSAFVGRTSFVLMAGAVAFLVACSDAVTPPTAASPLDASTVSEAASLPIANATVQVLSGLNGAIPWAINEFEEVVGATAAGQPFHWSPSNGLTVLPTNGHSPGHVAAINDYGVMAGAVTDPRTGVSRVATWLPSDQMELIGSIPDSSSAHPASCGATGQTFDGKIVGSCEENSSQTAEVFPWHGAYVGTANAIYNTISDDDWIGGASTSGTTLTAPFLINPNGQTIILRGHDAAVHTGSAVTAVAIHGWAAGYSNEGGCQQAVAWFHNSAQTSFPEYRLGVCGASYGVTDNWYVVGTSSTNWAFVWFPGVGLQRLPGLGGTGETSSAFAISLYHAVGTITSGGVTQVVIWTIAPRS